MSFVTNRKILKLTNLSNLALSYGIALTFAFWAGISPSSVVLASLFGGWSLANGYLARRLLESVPETTKGNLILRLETERGA